MSALNLFNFLSSINQGPKPGQTRYYHDNAIFKESITACGDSITCGSSLILGEAAICGDTYITVNPIQKNPKFPNLYVSGSIFGFKNLIVSNISTFNNTVIANRNMIVNGKIILAGCGDVATEIQLAKSLPSSDERLKENVKTLQNPIEKVKQLRGVSFDFIKDKKKQIGVIAQEVEKVIPEVVEDRYDGYKGVNYGNLVGLLIEAIKEQQDQITELKKEIETLKGDKINE